MKTHGGRSEVTSSENESRLSPGHLQVYSSTKSSGYYRKVFKTPRQVSLFLRFSYRTTLRYQRKIDMHMQYLKMTLSSPKPETPERSLTHVHGKWCRWVEAGEPGHPTLTGVFTPRTPTVTPAAVVPAFATVTVVLNESPATQYDLIADFLDTDMVKMGSDMLRSETLRTPGSSNTNQESSDIYLWWLWLVGCVWLTRVSEDDELRVFVILRMNREFMEYMRTTYPDTPLSEWNKISRSPRLISSQGLTFDRIK